MARYVGKYHTPRNNIPYTKIPTVRGPVFGHSVLRYRQGDYAAMLDAVFEVVAATGQAIDTVIGEHGWHLLSSDKDTIARLLHSSREVVHCE